MTNAQAQATLVALSVFANPYSKVNKAILNKIGDDNSRQTAIVEFESVCNYLKSNNYKLLNIDTRQLCYLETERFEVVPVLDIYGKITDGTKSRMVKRAEYYLLVNDIKELSGMADTCAKASVSMTEMRNEKLFALLRRKAHIDANTRVVLHWVDADDEQLAASTQAPIRATVVQTPVAVTADF